jgi:hypothetical protein
LSRSETGFALLQGDAKLFVFLEVTLAVEPILHGGGEAVERDSIADFESAVGEGKGVVEDGVVGEVAHGKVVEPLDGTGLGGGGFGEEFDGDFALEHG